MAELTAGFESQSSGKVHFTYKAKADMTVLCQGDVLSITEELREILQKVHPYFLGEQYKYFMVLTQSCDLVRRDGTKCKSPYITLAAVRNYDELLIRELISSEYAEQVEGFLLMNSKKQTQAYQFIERLFNNNESDFFFLYKEDKLDFPESMVATLKVSIALKSSQHYDTCLKAKKLELSDEFKAKLGWLVGDLYSRVGTADWEMLLNKNQRKKMIHEEITSHCILGSAEHLKIIKDELHSGHPHFSSLEEAAKYIEGIHLPSQYEKAIEALETAITNAKTQNTSPDDIAIILNTIRSSATFKAIFQR